MHEATGPTVESLSLTKHLLQPVIRRAADDPGRAVAAYRDGDHYVVVQEHHADVIERLYVQRAKTDTAETPPITRPTADHVVP